MFSFQGASEFLSSRDSMKHLLFQSCFSQSLFLVEISGFEPLTSCLQGRRSPSWAKPPYPGMKESGGPKWTRFPAGKPRRLKQSTGLFLSAGFRVLPRPSKVLWWAKMDSNHRPHDYQSCALASWAIGPYLVASSCAGSFPLCTL